MLVISLRTTLLSAAPPCATSSSTRSCLILCQIADARSSSLPLMVEFLAVSCILLTICRFSMNSFTLSVSPGYGQGSDLYSGLAYACS